MATAQPLAGQLVPLRTVQEVQLAHETALGNVVEIPRQFANQAVKYSKRASKRLTLPLQNRRTPTETRHLRRFVLHADLPPYLRSTPPNNLITAEDGTQAYRPTIFTLFPCSQFSADEFTEALKDHMPTDLPLICREIRIPMYPPPTLETAKQWSEEYWPCTYNPASQPLQHAPPPHILRSVRGEIEENVARFMGLAKQVGDEARARGCGRGIGAVIVDPDSGRIVAVAGDARWWTPSHAILEALRNQGSDGIQANGPQVQDGTEGRVEFHALMRAISLVSQKRLALPSQSTSPSLELSGLSLNGPRPLRSPRTALGEIPPVNASVEPSPPTSDLAAIVVDFTSDSTPPLSTPPIPGTPAVPATRSYQFEMSPIWQDPARQPPPSRVESYYLNSPISPLRSRAEGGYLCTNLDLYITHEPCLGCGMGMLHSRFRAVVFGKRLQCSGSLCAERSEPLDPPPKYEPQMKYGLFWRKELNWRTLGFQYIEDSGDHTSEDGGLFHA